MAAMVVSLPLVLILTLMAVSYFGERLVAAQAAPTCASNDMQEQTRAAMFVALDDAFRQRVAATYSVWMSDNRGQPARAKAGVDQAVAGYLHGYNAIQAWKLPPC